MRVRDMRIDGQSWYQWARGMFSRENCGECRRGVRGHQPAMVMGQWFAICKNGGSK